MFGYVTPCKMELKIKDYEVFKAYYCGLCIALKNNSNNLCRMALNYDMTFLAILIDSLEDSKVESTLSSCIAHPLKKRAKIINNNALNYASFCNLALVYYKLLDDYTDDKAVFKKLTSFGLKKYITTNKELSPLVEVIESNLAKLSSLEKSGESIFLDEISDKFATLTAFIISYYYKDSDFYDSLYSLGYNLGRWIYIIDAYDDLNEDMKKNRFNAINKAFNLDNLPYNEFLAQYRDRIEFNLILSANAAVEALNNLTLTKNKDLLYNILQLGLMNKIESIKLRSEENHD